MINRSINDFCLCSYLENFMKTESYKNAACEDIKGLLVRAENVSVFQVNEKKFTCL